jgi:hypothetical protein
VESYCLGNKVCITADVSKNVFEVPILGYIVFTEWKFSLLQVKLIKFKKSLKKKMLLFALFAPYCW